MHKEREEMINEASIRKVSKELPGVLVGLFFMYLHIRVLVGLFFTEY